MDGPPLSREKTHETRKDWRTFMEIVREGKMKRKHILIVDDDLNILRSMEFILEAADFEVSAGRNGQEALEKIKLAANHSPVDLLITDIQMPGLTGLQLIDEVQRMKLSIPALVVTAYGDQKLRRELRQRGCLHYLYKPFDEEKLLEKVFTILGESRESPMRRNIDANGTVPETKG